VRVAIVAPLVAPIREPQLGGAQTFLADLARGLAARGHDVEVYAASESVLPGVKIVDTGVDHRALQATLYRADGSSADDGEAAERAFGRLYEVVRDRGHDVVHNHAFDSPAIELASALEAPVVHTLHLPPASAVAEALRRASLRGRPPTVACVSEHQAQAWRRLVRVDAILPPLVPTADIPFSPRAGEGAVFAGRLSAEKGAAEAIEIARTAGIPIELFGDSYDDRYARERVEPRRSDPDVLIRPGVPRRELWQVMARAAVVLCPAGWDEPFGMVAAEAQACGTPVVAFRRGALAQVVIDQVTGFVVEPGDIRAAAEGVRRSPGLSRRQCRVHAESELDLGSTIDAHERLYERIAATRAGAASSA
jgi:UDP-glucose:tetrahydrobiopterin glucosyltransferase